MNSRLKILLGFQKWHQNTSGYGEMFCYGVRRILIVQICLFLAVAFWLIARTQDVAMVKSYVKALLVSSFFKSEIIEFWSYGKQYEGPASAVVTYLRDGMQGALQSNIVSAVKYSFCSWLIVPYAFLKFHREASKLTETKYISGARFATVKEIQRYLKQTGDGTIGIGSEFVMTRSIENEHCYVSGRTGSGKTRIALQMISDIRKKNGKAVIYDPQGGILSAFYDPTRDLLFDPADQRHCGWSVMRELDNVMDIDAVAQSLIPDAHNQDLFWHNGARAVFAGCLNNLALAGEKTNSAIWEFLQQEGKDITASLKLTGQPGWKYIEDPLSRQAASIFATLQQFIQCFQIMRNTDSDFTIKTWLDDPRGGFIFITNYEDIRDTLRPVLSLFIDLLGRRLLALPNSDTRRIYFVIDELATLQRLPTLISLLTRSRAKGGCCFLFNQEITPLDRLYGKENRDSIMDCCGSKIIMSQKDPNTAEFCSKLIGDTEIEETHISYNIGGQKVRGSASVSQKKRIKPLVLPSTIQHELGVDKNGNSDYSFYLLLSRTQLIKTTTKKMDLPSVAPEFLLRQDLRLDQIRAEYEKNRAEAESKQKAEEKERIECEKRLKSTRQSLPGKNTDWIKEAKKRGGLDFKELDF